MRLDIISVTIDFRSSEHRLGNLVGQHSARAEAGRTQHSGGQNDVSPLNLPPEQRGLPTPACLAEILLSARQLLMEQVGECFYVCANWLVTYFSTSLSCLYYVLICYRWFAFLLLCLLSFVSEGCNVLLFLLWNYFSDLQEYPAKRDNASCTYYGNDLNNISKYLF